MSKRVGRDAGLSPRRGPSLLPRAKSIVKFDSVRNDEPPSAEDLVTVGGRIMAKKTVRDIDVRGKRVLVRVDFNVPVKDGVIADDRRIREALPTIEYLLREGARVILVSHLGRPKAPFAPEFSLAPVRARLEELLGRPVKLAPDVVGPEVERMAEELRPGEVLLLENVRYYPEETKNDPDFAARLARLADVYVNDAFGTAHRAHASTEGVARLLPSVSGFLLAREVEVLRRVLEQPERPFVAILGGAKIADKIGVIENLLGRVDALLVGGGIANTFLVARGYEVGLSLYEPDGVDVARRLLCDAEALGVDLLLPVDAVVAAEISETAETQVVPVEEVPADGRIGDIGPRTRELYRERLRGARTIVWNGPMGVFELSPFAEGTIAVARAVAESGAYSVIGGGDSLAAVKLAGVEDKVSHLSTGGGATLEFLEGKELPGIAVLPDA
ncbi:MAG: Phosphoglycerate kinase [Brockia lithotrophica]|uniref:Phosphoglycerate kinase n=1 Tax=Brockia lithotrophica TaxID=933949 RepID=A0A2T5G401_9BACL|nr:MAG: Phosphoglycerate kinase [Brockia lithotrophica]